MFLPYKKIIALASITGFSLLGLLAAKPPTDEKPKYKNLQILSQKISDEDMDYVMESFSVNLGSNCLFCHPGKQEGPEFSIDYVTDVLQNKRVARDMLRMTFMLNKKYFDIKMTGKMNTRGKVWCKTCHMGSPVPLLPPGKFK
jgi:hypothetical protein